MTSISILSNNTDKVVNLRLLLVLQSGDGLCEFNTLHCDRTKLIALQSVQPQEKKMEYLSGETPAWLHYCMICFNKPHYSGTNICRFPRNARKTFSAVLERLSCTLKNHFITLTASTLGERQPSMLRTASQMKALIKFELLIRQKCRRISNEFMNSHFLSSSTCWQRTNCYVPSRFDGINTCVDNACQYLHLTSPAGLVIYCQCRVVVYRYRQSLEVMTGRLFSHHCRICSE